MSADDQEVLRLIHRNLLDAAVSVFDIYPALHSMTMQDYIAHGGVGPRHGKPEAVGLAETLESLCYEAVSAAEALARHLGHDLYGVGDRQGIGGVDDA